MSIEVMGLWGLHIGRSEHSTSKVFRSAIDDGMLLQWPTGG